MMDLARELQRDHNRSRGSAVFSVIIPTLQRANQLIPLLHTLCQHRLVGETIVINNASKPISFRHPKLCVLDQEENIFVNPAWNLGARVARYDHLFIANDDITVPPLMLEFVHKRLERGSIGLVGADADSLGPTSPRRRPRMVHVRQRTWGFGTAMFLPRENYVPIPGPLKIWYGDDYLFHHQTRPNYTVSGFPLRTQMSVTSGSPEFTVREHREFLDYGTLHQDVYVAAMRAKFRFTGLPERGARFARTKWEEVTGKPPQRPNHTQGSDR